MAIEWLELASTDDLLTEIMSRVDHGGIALCKVGQPNPEETTVYRRTTGCAHTTIGLLYDVIDTVVEHIRNAEEIFDENPDDELEEEP